MIFYVIAICEGKYIVATICIAIVQIVSEIRKRWVTQVIPKRRDE